MMKAVARSGRPLPASVEVQLPSWLGGGDPAAAAASARWQATATAGATWNLRLQERHGQRPGLVRSDLLGHAGNVDSPGTWARLAQLPPHAEHQAPGVAERIAAHIRSTPTGGSLTDVLARLVLTTQACPEQQLPEIVRDGLRLLLSLGDLEQGQEVHLVRVHEALARRAALARVLAQLEQPTAARVLARLAEAGGAPPPDSPLAAARHIGSDLTYGFTAYLGPLLLAVSPYVWAVSAPRAGGVLVYTLGTAVAGRPTQYAELLQLLQPRLGGGPPPPRPPLTPTQLRAALTWYVHRLDALLSAATDPTRYADKAGRYQPSRHLEALLSLEQVFRSMQAVGALGRSEHARRVLGLSALDALQGLGLADALELCKLPRAQRALHELEAAVPPAAATVLLPRARAAVEGLERLQDGFLSREPGGLRLPNKHNGHRVWSLSDAAAQWLRVLRNADHHAFGGTGDTRPRDVALLLAHNGDVPAGVGDLPWLYLLQLLLQPNLLRAR